MDDTQTAIRLTVALAVGLLIGLERGWHQRQQGEGTRLAGLRTFTLVGFLGGLSAILATAYGAVYFVITAIAVGLVVLLGMILARRQRTDAGITTDIALLVTFALGGFAGIGELQISAAAAVVVAILLGLKPTLHGWLRHMEERELFAAFKWLVMTVIILPILPDRGMGPWDALNPFVIWLMVVLISGFSFAGYVAVKLVGLRRGLMLTGVLGGLTSSTAIAVSMARLCAQSKAAAPAATAAAFASSAIVYPRIGLVAALFAPGLASQLAPALGAMLLASLLALIFIWPRQAATAPADAKKTDWVDPFNLSVPLQFAALLALVMLAAAAVQQWLGDAGFIAVSALAGLTDVDAVTLTATQLFQDGTAATIAGTAILVATGVNVLAKWGILAWIGGRQMALRTGLGFAVTLLAGAAVWWVSYSGISSAK